MALAVIAPRRSEVVSKRGGFRLVDADELALGELASLAFEVHDLAADEFPAAAGCGEFGDVIARAVALVGGASRQHDERFG